VAEEAHGQGGLFGYVHPFDTDPDPDDSTTALTNGLPVDVALGRLDYFEVVGFSDHLATARVWYRLLNCGFRLPAGAGTDAMTNYASLRGPLGTDRVYVKSGFPLDRARWYGALKAGKTMATNGPLVRFTVNGEDAGSEVRLPAGSQRLSLRVSLRSQVPVDHLQIMGPAGVVSEIGLHGDGTRADTTITISASQSGWYLARAWSEKAEPPVLDIYPFGTTSPVYVTIGDARVRSAADADFFLRWIDRLETAVNAHEGWNSTAERREVLSHLQQAREEFEKRR